MGFSRLDTTSRKAKIDSLRHKAPGLPGGRGNTSPLLRGTAFLSILGSCAVVVVLPLLLNSEGAFGGLLGLLQAKDEAAVRDSLGLQEAAQVPEDEAPSWEENLLAMALSQSTGEAADRAAEAQADAPAATPDTQPDFSLLDAELWDLPDLEPQSTLGTSSLAIPQQPEQPALEDLQAPRGR